MLMFLHLPHLFIHEHNIMFTVIILAFLDKTLTFTQVSKLFLFTHRGQQDPCFKVCKLLLDLNRGDVGDAHLSNRRMNGPDWRKRLSVLKGQQTRHAGSIWPSTCQRTKSVLSATIPGHMILAANVLPCNTSDLLPFGDGGLAPRDERISCVTTITLRSVKKAYNTKLRVLSRNYRLLLGEVRSMP